VVGPAKAQAKTEVAGLGGQVVRAGIFADHKKLGIAWDSATLDKYLTNPRAMVPDTSMVYAGLKDDAQRADLVAYLETLH
jgi:cytochrome c2